MTRDEYDKEVASINLWHAERQTYYESVGARETLLLTLEQQRKEKLDDAARRDEKS